jgi:hypothetical protein
MDADAPPVFASIRGPSLGRDKEFAISAPAAVAAWQIHLSGLALSE